jgi:pseudouridine synthase
MKRERKTLERILSRAGAMSRKQAEAAIAAGRVRVNGLRARDPGAWIDLAQDLVTLDGERLRSAARIYLALHKPRGYVTTRSDERGRKTVYALFGATRQWVAPVGRLDRDTSGLLLFTNDTDLANAVTAPESKLARRYECLARGLLGAQAIERLRRGVELADGPTRPARVRLLGGEGPNTRIEIAITEGRNRQVRRMLEAVGSRALALHRIAIGPVELGGLPEGRWRELTAREVDSLRRP